MKRKFLVVLPVVLLFALSACGLMDVARESAREAVADAVADATDAVTEAIYDAIADVITEVTDALPDVIDAIADAAETFIIADAIESAAPAQTDGVIVLGAYNISGPPAIPVVFDAYEQFLLLISPHPGAQTGFDADFSMQTSMEMNMEGFAMTSSSTALGNVRTNIDGNRSQSVMTMDTMTVMDMPGIGMETVSMSSVMAMETEGANITFLRMVIDGDVIDDAMTAEVLDMMPDMNNFPTFGVDAILSAEVREAGGETIVALVLDPNQMTDFFGAVLGTYMDEMLGRLGLGVDINFNTLNIDIALDGAGVLSRVYMFMDMDMFMEMDLGGEVITTRTSARSTTIYTYNYIGPLQIDTMSS